MELGNDVVQLTEFSELNIFSKHVTFDFSNFYFVPQLKEEMTAQVIKTASAGLPVYLCRKNFLAV